MGGRPNRQLALMVVGDDHRNKQYRCRGEQSGKNSGGQCVGHHLQRLVPGWENVDLCLPDRISREAPRFWPRGRHPGPSAHGTPTMSRSYCRLRSVLKLVDNVVENDE
jgi:hypothetical protein